MFVELVVDVVEFDIVVAVGLGEQTVIRRSLSSAMSEQTAVAVVGSGRRESSSQWRRVWRR